MFFMSRTSQISPWWDFTMSPHPTFDPPLSGYSPGREGHKASLICQESPHRWSLQDRLSILAFCSYHVWNASNSTQTNRIAKTTHIRSDAYFHLPIIMTKILNKLQHKNSTKINRRCQIKEQNIFSPFVTLKPFCKHHNEVQKCVITYKGSHRLPLRSIWYHLRHPLWVTHSYIFT